MLLYYYVYYNTFTKNNKFNFACFKFCNQMFTHCNIGDVKYDEIKQNTVKYNKIKYIKCIKIK